MCTGGEDGIIRVWDCLTFALIDELSGHAGGLRALTIWEGLLCSMSGMREKGRLGTNLSYIMYFFIILYYIILYYICIGMREKGKAGDKCILWDLTNRLRLRALEVWEGDVCCCIVCVWVGGGRGVCDTLLYIDTHTHTHTHTHCIIHADARTTQVSEGDTCCCISRNGVLATAGAQGVVSLWDVSTQRHLLSLPAHSEPITSIVFPPDDPASEWDKEKEEEEEEEEEQEEEDADPTGRSVREDRGEGGGERGEKRRRRVVAAGARGAGAGAGASDALGLKRMLTASHDQTVRVWDLVRLAEIDADMRM